MLKNIVLTGIMLLLLLLCGCWDSRDLEDLSFPLAAAYDLHHPGSADLSDPPAKSGNNVVDLTTLLPNLSPQTKSPVQVETLSGVTIADIRQRRGLTDTDTYVTGMNRTIIVGEDLARQGLNSYMDAVLRGTTITGTMYFAVAVGRGEDILKTPIKSETNMGTYLMGLFNGIQNRTFIPVTTLGQFFINQSTGKNPVAPILQRIGDRVIISGVAIFKKDRMVKKTGY